VTTLGRRLLVVLVAAGAIAVAGDPAVARSGQETPPPAKATPAKPAPTPTPAPTPKPTPTADPEEQLEEFVPTEKLPADQAVAFPVDI
jgi:outer membrane biosynthesis protein TonB